MPSSVRPASPSTLQEDDGSGNKKVRTVSADQSGASGSAATRRSKSLARRGLGSAARNLQRRRRRKSGSISDADFFEREAILVDDDTPPDNHAPQTMQAPSTPKIGRPGVAVPVRLDSQDGPWAISVAEAPHDPSSYCLYIKTPTHNLTLTRTTMEILELDHKLRDSNPGLKLPALPFDAAVVRQLPKRKSNFLNTLSRFASPSKHPSRASSTVTTTAQPTPAAESSDPFSTSFAASDIQTALPAPTAVSTGLAAYLTTVSNDSQLRQARVWKRFVRVRTEDLESVRVERAIQHVRSDLAAQLGLAKGRSEDDKENMVPETAMGSSTPTDEDPTTAEPTKAVPPTLTKEQEVTLEPKLEENATVEHSIDTEQSGAEEPVKEVVESEAEPVTVDEKVTEDVTPAPVDSASIVSDSHEDKSVSRAVSYSTFQDGTSSHAESQAETGDESSVSTSARRRRKKRSMSKVKKSQRKVVIDDFEMMRVLGKGCAGKVLLVRHKTTQDLYALKAITKRHVLAHQELQHTLTEQAVLKRMAAESRDPFVIKLWWSFHDKENLFLVMDFHPGGDLATQLARWGRLGRDRARFYAAEIVEGCEGLHAAGVIYRDLKPENILIGGDGHIVLTDFGLSKEFPRHTSSVTAPATPTGSRNDLGPHSVGHVLPATPPWMKMNDTGELALGWPGHPAGRDTTTTFCGTAEYLAPEVIQGQSYGYEIDWWSFGTMLYEMLTGITPFWANNHSDMYVRVLQDELHFPDDRSIDQDTKSLIRGLLQKNPALRISEPRIKKHPYFSMIDWSHVYYKRYIPPYIPPIDPANAGDTQNFDETFLDMQPVLDDPYDNEGTDAEESSQGQSTDTDRTDGEDSSNNTPSQSRSSSVQPKPLPEEDDSVDVFDGYSFKGRHSVLIDSDGESDSDSSSEDGETDEDLVGAEEPIAAVVPPDLEQEEEEPKTPEARPAALPSDPSVPEKLPEEVPVEAATPTEPSPPVDVETAPVPRPSREFIRPPKEVPRPLSSEVSPVVPEKEAKVDKVPAAVSKPVVHKPAKNAKGRREKSGVQALDKYLETDIEETGPERDEEDDDWDFIEADGGEDRNGNKGTSLFARGVVDKYRLAVFRKASTPTHQLPRTVSGMSSATAESVPASPTPSQRRGRTSGPLFRKNPKPFSKSSKTPPSSFSSRSALTSSTPTGSTRQTTLAESPSLKSRGSRSAMSVGATSSSDQSANGEMALLPEAAAQNGPPSPEEKKGKKLKKYKEGAEKMLGSIFSGASSPRPQHHQQQP